MTSSSMRARIVSAWRSIWAGEASASSSRAMPTRTPLMGRSGPVLLERVEEGEPLLGVLGLGDVAAGRVEQDRLIGEEPVAVPRPADAAHAVRPDGKVEPGLRDGRRLARARRADEEVPRQGVERRLPPARQPPFLTQLRLLERLDGPLQVLLEPLDLGLLVGPDAELLGVGLRHDLLFEPAGGLRRPHLHHEHDEPDHEEGDEEDEAGHDERPLHHQPAEQDERDEDDEPQRDQEAPARKQFEQPLHGFDGCGACDPSDGARARLRKNGGRSGAQPRAVRSPRGSLSWITNSMSCATSSAVLEM